LSKSLNIPATKMLEEYGTEKFYRNLKAMGMTTLHKNARHYGLSMILGGAETTLEDLASIYSGMARTLMTYAINSRYDRGCFHKPNYIFEEEKIGRKLQWEESGFLSAAAVWHTFESMAELVRPDLENNWQSFGSSSKIAWKTGTSFGFRDAWAIGCTPEYTIAVWVGNADGEGRPGLKGISVAAPILFDIFNGLKKSEEWFVKPAKNMTNILVCKKSGHRATNLCTEADLQLVPMAGLRTSPCPYHKLIHLDATGEWQVNGECYSPQEMVSKSFFVLPPMQEYYYRLKNPDYIALPAYRNDCKAMDADLQIVYPSQNRKIYIPIMLDGATSNVVLKAACSDKKLKMYWHIDNEFVGETKEVHELAVNPGAGQHLLTVVTEKGDFIQKKFEVIENKINKN